MLQLTCFAKSALSIAEGLGMTEDPPQPILKPRSFAALR